MALTTMIILLLMSRSLPGIGNENSTHRGSSHLISCSIAYGISVNNGNGYASLRYTIRLVSDITVS